jgi:hypothetical protein
MSCGFSFLAAFQAEARGRVEDLAARLGAARELRLGERLYNQPQQSRIANTTIVVIAISVTTVAILWYCWWH